MPLTPNDNARIKRLKDGGFLRVHRVNNNRHVDITFILVPLGSGPEPKAIRMRAKDLEEAYRCWPTTFYKTEEHLREMSRQMSLDRCKFYADLLILRDLI